MTRRVECAREGERGQKAYPVNLHTSRSVTQLSSVSCPRLFVLAAARLRTAAAVVMQAVKLKLKALPRHSQAAISRLSTDVRAKVAAKKQERAASKEAKNASAGGAASSPAAAESAGSAGQGMQKIRALSQAARRSASKLSASFSKKDRYPRRRVPCFTPPASHLRGGAWGAIGGRGAWRARETCAHFHDQRLSKDFT